MIKTLDEELLPVYEQYHATFQKLLEERKNERDIRVKHFELFASDLAEHINIIKCVNVLGVKYPKEIEEVTNYTKEQIELLFEKFHDTILSDCFLKLIMRTELLLRILYGELNAGSDPGKPTISQVISSVLSDTENKWQKEESKLLVMLWDARNSIHMSGIYSKNDRAHTYKGQNYLFEKEMRGVPFSAEQLIYLMKEVSDVIDRVIHSAPIDGLPDKDHPFYKVFGK